MQADKLIEGLSAQHLLADKGYDTDAIVQLAQEQEMKPQIPPKKNRKGQREYDNDIYKLRHLIKMRSCISKGGQALRALCENNRLVQDGGTNPVHLTLGDYFVTTLSRCQATL
jgi:IS5 family transposase